MKKKNYGVILGALTLEILLIALLFLAGLFFFSYFEANLIVWENFSILAFAAGWDRFWMMLYLASDALLFVILIFLFLEVVLFLIRTAAKTVFKAVEKTLGASQDKALGIIKKISLLTLFRAMKINTVKKGIIAYVIVIALMLLSGWIPKQVLQSREALVYRTFETKNLFSKVDAPDFSAEIDSRMPFDVVIQGGVANVHLYQVSDTTEAKLYLLYDEERVLSDYSFTIDRENGRLTILVNQTQTSYEPYVDWVLPSVEVYLPDQLVIDDVQIDVQTHGSVAVDYLQFQSIDVSMKEGELYVRQTKDQAALIARIEAVNAQVTLQFERVGELTLVLNGTRANVRVKAIDHALTIDAIHESDLFMYQISAESIDARFADSIVQLREVYAPTILLDATNTSLTFVNGLSSYPYLTVDLTLVGGSASLRGLPDDAQGE